LIAASLSRLLHDDLHWLDVLERLRYKLRVTTYLCLHHTAPQYLLSTYFLALFFCVAPHIQWRSKALRGPWFNSKLAALSCEVRRADARTSESGCGVLKGDSEPSLYQLGSQGERYNLPMGYGAKPQPPSVFIFSVFSDDLSCYGKSRVHCAKRPIIFLPYFLCRPAQGPRELGGPGSLNRLNPRFLCHCAHWLLTLPVVSVYVLQVVVISSYHPTDSAHSTVGPS